MRRLLALAMALAAALLFVRPAQAAAPTGTLSIASATVAADSPVSFSYTTTSSNAKNWVGLYSDPGNGPVNQTYVASSAKWIYTPGTSGTASLPTTGLAAGNYILYYLYNDGYTWLAQPVPFRIVDPAAGPSWLSTAFPLRNGKVSALYSATVAGLVRGSTTGLTFSKTSGPAWASVSPSGVLSGTPTAAGTVTVGVRATNSAGNSADATVTIRVQSGVLVPQLRALTWNLWHGGTQVVGGLDKELRFLLDQDIDVVGIQENGGTAAQQIASALGWSFYQNTDQAVISRYPITATTPTVAGSAVAATIDLGSRSLRLWSAHLGYHPYGPYDACFGRMNVQQLMDREAQSGRTGQINSIISAMNSDLSASASTPVLLVGDFNSASHLDWTSAKSRCGYGAVPWPTSVSVENAGLIDSYRQANPNPATDPGMTWSPLYKTFTGGYGYDSHIGEPEPQDRIDFIHYKGPLTVLSSQTLWTGSPSQTNPSSNLWTSDHAAVLTVFQVG
ncbi:endonuclease/exonuclease/phosphatase family protein [Streptomyces sp. HNM0663]|uniref:Endonuclease/exonuclease/phosphatase family protein n=1 Tax=Streptomyces chengmaiensis TaxID=3040919 RepID=A0ABT6HSK2_9ACTN|nr:endonuclease/exonuclease/phosphatase family protein [Streptomyces chengmaiensis]MDH2391565.1 endonuclease/exonuclease/phosphatase family protein [Streptomyces chengmaiensis]